MRVDPPQIVIVLQPWFVYALMALAAIHTANVVASLYMRFLLWRLERLVRKQQKGGGDA